VDVSNVHGMEGVRGSNPLSSTKHETAPDQRKRGQGPFPCSPRMGSERPVSTSRTAERDPTGRTWADTNNRQWPRGDRAFA
jgi:hypothetical protein